MKESSKLRFAVWQVMIVAGAIVAYFGVRGLTEGDPAAANRNADRVLDLEHALRIAVEQAVQDAVTFSAWSMTIANWVYIWMHWPVVIATFVWLIRTNRPEYVRLRNAMLISGFLGLLIFASFPVAPPRLFSVDFVDTVTQRSYSYRMLQPPAFVNRYAAMPSLHFGWNLLVGLAWFRVARSRRLKVAAVVMPAAMAWAVVATGNHWVLDVIIGGIVALIGLAVEVVRHDLMRPRAGTIGARRPVPLRRPTRVGPSAAQPPPIPSHTNSLVPAEPAPCTRAAAQHARGPISWEECADVTFDPTTRSTSSEMIAAGREWRSHHASCGRRSNCDPISQNR